MTPELTEREIEVLRLTSFGVEQKEIGERLGVSHQVVRHNVMSAVRKLGARNRTHAVAIAIRQGLIVLTALEFAHRIYASWGM